MQSYDDAEKIEGLASQQLKDCGNAGVTFGLEKDITTSLTLTQKLRKLRDQEIQRHNFRMKDLNRIIRVLEESNVEQIIKEAEEILYK